MVVLAKELTVSKWQSVVKENGIKDIGLIPLLGKVPRLKTNDEITKALDDIEKLMDKLEADKKVSAIEAVTDHLDDMRAAVERARAEVEKLQAKEEEEAEKAAKKEAAEDAKKEAEEQDEGEDEDDEAEVDKDTSTYGTRLKDALAVVKKGSASGIKCQVVVCAKGTEYALSVAKPNLKIGPKQKKFLSDMLKGGRCLPAGTVSFVGGKYDFALDNLGGLTASKLQKALKDATGKGYGLRVGKEEVDDVPEDAKKGPAKSGAAGVAEGVEDAKVPEAVVAPKPKRPDSVAEPDLKKKPGDLPDTEKKKETTSPEQKQQPDTGKTPETGETPTDVAPPAGDGVHLKGSVGLRGKNGKGDVIAVQRALNREIGAGLKEDDKCGPATIKAIEKYQRTIGFPAPDCLVEPGGPTESWLNGKQVAIPKPKAAAKPAAKKGGAVPATAGDVAKEVGEAAEETTKKKPTTGGQTPTEKAPTGREDDEQQMSIPDEEPNQSFPDEPDPQVCKAVAADAKKSSDDVEKSKQDAQKKFDEAVKKLKTMQKEGEKVPAEAKQFLKELQENYARHRKSVEDAKKALVDAGIAAAKAKAKEEIEDAKKAIDFGRKQAEDSIEGWNDLAQSALDFAQKRI